jgi:hypothetical protein
MLSPVLSSELHYLLHMPFLREPVQSLFIILLWSYFAVRAVSPRERKDVLYVMFVHCILSVSFSNHDVSVS